MFPDEIDLCEEGSGLHDEVKDDKLLLLLSFEITTGDSEAAAAAAAVEFFMTISLKFNFAVVVVGVGVGVGVGFPNDGNRISLDNSITVCCDSVAVAETSESRDC